MTATNGTQFMCMRMGAGLSSDWMKSAGADCMSAQQCTRFSALTHSAEDTQAHTHTTIARHRINNREKKQQQQQQKSEIQHE